VAEDRLARSALRVRHIERGTGSLGLCAWKSRHGPIVAVALVTLGIGGCTTHEEWPVIDVSNGCETSVYAGVSGDVVPFDQIPDDQEGGGLLARGDTMSYVRLTFRGGALSVVVTPGSLADPQKMFYVSLDLLEASVDEHGRDHRSLVIEGEMCPPPGGW
jgi:hypothetical protein